MAAQDQELESDNNMGDMVLNYIHQSARASPPPVSPSTGAAPSEEATYSEVEREDEPPPTEPVQQTAAAPTYENTSAPSAAQQPLVSPQAPPVPRPRRAPRCATAVPLGPADLARFGGVVAQNPQNAFWTVITAAFKGVPPAMLFRNVVLLLVIGGLTGLTSYYAMEHQQLSNEMTALKARHEAVKQALLSEALLIPRKSPRASSGATCFSWGAHHSLVRMSCNANSAQLSSCWSWSLNDRQIRNLFRTGIWPHTTNYCPADDLPSTASNAFSETQPAMNIEEQADPASRLPHEHLFRRNNRVPVGPDN